MANKKPSKKQPAKKQPAKKQPAKTAETQPAKKAAVKKAQPKNQASKKSSAKPKTSTDITAELEVTFAYTPSPVNITTTANQTAYQITESVLNAVDSTVVRVQDITQKTLRQRMIAWFKR
jgi:hypothetical protein